MKGLDQLKIVLLLPEPYYTAWNNLFHLCEDFKKLEENLSGLSEWPVLALGIKSARTTQSIGSLAAMQQWQDAMILGRALFETEIIVKYLLHSETKLKVEEYLNEILDEEIKLKAKMKEGISVSAQMMNDLFSDQDFLSSNLKTHPKKRNLKSIREKARITAIDRSYDICYWMESLICHSHALSISQWNPDLLKINSPFVKMFSNSFNELSSSMVLQALPFNSLDTLQLVDHYCNLGLKDKIENVRQNFRDVSIKLCGITKTYSKDIKRGDVIMNLSNGETIHYSPKMTGKDPLDNLL
jgi:hypothetical protein